MSSRAAAPQPRRTVSARPASTQSSGGGALQSFLTVNVGRRNPDA